jgi:hypothetical protein
MGFQRVVMPEKNQGINFNGTVTTIEAHCPSEFKNKFGPVVEDLRNERWAFLLCGTANPQMRICREIRLTCK